MKSSVLLSILTVMILLVAGASPCLGHKMRVFAWKEQGLVISEAKFSGGRPAQLVTITVTDRTSGETILVGNTDATGRYAFPSPAGVGELHIIADGGDGHRASWNLLLRDTTDSPLHPAGSSANPAREPVAQNIDLPSTNLSEEQLRQMLSEVVAAELAPIRKTLAENSESTPTLQDILGALGYILGLAGIAAYIHSRKKS